MEFNYKSLLKIYLAPKYHNLDINLAIKKVNIKNEQSKLVLYISEDPLHCLIMPERYYIASLKNPLANLCNTLPIKVW